MPQCDVFYSRDIQIDFSALFRAIEARLNEQDASAKLCKSRAVMADACLHASVSIRIALLQKPHRDKAFMQQCLANMKATVAPFIPSGIYYAIEVVFSGEHYLTLKAG